MGWIDMPPYPPELYKNLNWFNLEVISREGWGALPPSAEEVPFDQFPVAPIVMGYTETPECKTKEECKKMMQELQKKHMAEGMSDIRYSFVIGGDANVYEGRGFHYKTGVHNRYSHLNGTNVEFVISGTRGNLPDVKLSRVMWRLQDQGVWDGYLTEVPQLLQDFEDPVPDFQEEELETTGEVVSAGTDWSKIGPGSG